MLPDSPEIRGPLFPTETKFDSAMWDKQYYERARDEVLALVPPEAKRILSIGCGWGASEATLVARGIEVVGLPLDCVVAVTARQRGVSTLPPDFKMARRQLEGSRFDCILFWDTLHRLPDPVAILRDYVPLLEPSGTLILTMPNFDHVSVLLKRLRSQLCLSAKDPYKTYGLHLTRYPKVKRWLRQARLQTWTWDATVAPRFKQIDRISFGVLRRFLVKNIAVSARPPSLSTNPAQ
jgi:2-polyprenyl-3-methyl-5-hydroxy-6-metoxy-1,4-benzoquinol methylase